MLARWFLDVGFQVPVLKIDVISGLGAVISGAQNYHLAGLVAPFWHPGAPLWHLGGALGGHRSSRKDTWDPELDFYGF